jgi:hypothetical protein
MKLTKLATIALGLTASTVYADTGINPIPVFSSVSATSTATYDPTATCYYYNYSVTNPSTNTGAVQFIKMDLSTPYKYFDPNTCSIPLLIPRGSNVSFNPNFSIPLAVQHQGHVLSFGEAVPDGWMGTADAIGMSGFATMGPSARIQPGHTQGGFQIQSSNPPTLKLMEVRPHWLFEPSSEATAQDEVAAGKIRAGLVATTTVIGPSSFFPGSEDHWNQLRNDIASLIQMGWISDSAFGNNVTAQLAAARTINDNQGPAYITPTLNTLLATIQASTASQRNEAAYDLLLLNTQALIAFAEPPNSEPPGKQIIPKPSIITPAGQTFALNTPVTITVQVVDQANNNAPIPDYPTRIDIQGGTYASFDGTTDSNGKFSATYTETAVGTDQVYLHTTGGELNDDEIDVNWTGGPDLTIKYFIPPVVKWNGSSAVHVTEGTENIGTTAATPSATRYYFSATSPVDPTTAQVVGERQVPQLAPGSNHDNGGVDVQFPSGTPAGTYFMLACADANNVVAETNEDNNCQALQVAVALETSVQPPVCSSATPSQTLLWPPNHKFQTIGIHGVTDPNNVTPTITITGIQQDEPVNAAGDGNTAPDGEGVGTSTAQVRSERSGTAVGGRLYFINFSAADSLGGSCTGTVTVGVPHDQGQHDMPVDNGQRYDSTATK